MTMTPEIAGLRISRSIKSVENGMDELLARSAELMAEMARVRVATQYVAHAGQRPMARIVAMQKSLIEARSDLVRAHSDLSKLAETMDIPFECPEEGALNGLDGDKRELREVA